MLTGVRIMRIVLAIIGVCAVALTAQAQFCPGYNPAHNTNLACELSTGLRASISSKDPNAAATFGSLTSIYVTMGTQLSQLPIAAAASTSGITIGASGLPTVSTEGLGTILTQRGTTLGRHKLLFSFNFQRFVFQSVDGVDLKKMPFVFNPFIDTTTGNSIYIFDQSSLSFRVNQYTTITTFGLTKRIDVAVVVPFSQVGLDTGTFATLTSIAPSGNPVVTNFPATPNPLYLPGSAGGIGDVRANVKVNVFGEGKTSMAIGGEVRFPTGDAANFLGSGAYGIKPYMVISRRGRVTPNINIGYQWNGASILAFDKNLPSSFLYSGGADIRATKRLTLTGELIGQYVIDAPRVRLQTLTIPNVGARDNATSFKGSYFSNNASFGFKLNPFKGLILSSSALVKLDNNGLRQRAVVPLFGAAYRF